MLITSFLIMAFMYRNLLIKLGELYLSPQITCISGIHSILLVFFFWGGGGGGTGILDKNVVF